MRRSGPPDARPSDAEKEVGRLSTKARCTIAI
jgi:hypothetical protein